jgi:hypothetical protein
MPDLVIFVTISCLIVFSLVTISCSTDDFDTDPLYAALSMVAVGIVLSIWLFLAESQDWKIKKTATVTPSTFVSDDGTTRQIATFEGSEGRIRTINLNDKLSGIVGEHQKVKIEELANGFYYGVYFVTNEQIRVKVVNQ